MKLSENEFTFPFPITFPPPSKAEDARMLDDEILDIKDPFFRIARDSNLDVLLAIIVVVMV